MTSSMVIMPMGSPGLAIMGMGSMSSRSSWEESVPVVLLLLSLLLLLLPVSCTFQPADSESARVHGTATISHEWLCLCLLANVGHLALRIKSTHKSCTSKLH